MAGECWMPVCRQVMINEQVRRLITSICSHVSLLFNVARCKGIVVVVLEQLFKSVLEKLLKKRLFRRAYRVGGVRGQAPNNCTAGVA